MYARKSRKQTSATRVATEELSFVLYGNGTRLESRTVVEETDEIRTCTGDFAVNQDLH